METERLINFCDPSLQSTISSNTCSSESYEETNLLSSDTAKFRRGFMADRFIKPPVDIVVTFKHPVNLSHIIIWPRVGQQKSRCFEITTSFSERLNFSHEHQSKSNMALSSECEEFDSSEQIGYCSLSDINNGVLFFSPRKFRKCDTSSIIQDEMNFAKQSFKSFRQSAVTDVKTVKIKITRTFGSSVPALGRIEIWGKPGIRNTFFQKREQWQLWDRSLHQKQIHITDAPATEETTPVIGTLNEPTRTTSDLNVPEEFLDALTFEIMCLPMVLPSGKVIDQKTLERFQDTEANWGRAPSDPFTGVPFTSSLHPVLDNALKSRIDHFLVVHQDRADLRSVPRTLGRKKNSYGTKNTPENVSSLTMTNGTGNAPLLKHKTVPSQTTSANYTGGIFPTGVSQDTPGNYKINSHSKKMTERVSSDNFRNNHVSKDTVSNSNLSGQQKDLSESRKRSRNHCKKRSCSPEVEILSECVVSNKVVKMSKHQKWSGASVSGTQSNFGRSGGSGVDKLDDDLDDALNAVLTGLPSFVNTDKCSKPQSVPVQCCKCKNLENLFLLPCDHLTCRACLLESTKSKQTKCWSCQRSYTSSQPVKYHG